MLISSHDDMMCIMSSCDTYTFSLLWRFTVCMSDLSAPSQGEDEVKDAETRMPSETSRPGAESQKSDGFDKQWRVHTRTQNRRHPIHVLPAQPRQLLPNQEDSDHQRSFQWELWWSGYPVHWRGWRSNHGITLRFLTVGILSADVSVELDDAEKELCTLFHTHFLFSSVLLWRTVL